MRGSTAGGYLDTPRLRIDGHDFDPARTSEHIETLLPLLSRYGYGILLLGAMLEGEVTFAAESLPRKLARPW
jgi:hypothetical protein